MLCYTNAHLKSLWKPKIHGYCTSFICVVSTQNKYNLYILYKFDIGNFYKTNYGWSKTFAKQNVGTINIRSKRKNISLS